MSAHVAVVAGAGGGLGQATALTLAAGGLTVVAVDRNEAGLRQLPDTIRREVADTTDPAVATRLIDRIAGFLVSDAAAPVSGAILPAYGV